MIHSFLMIGQSNMAGRGLLDEAETIDTAHIKILRNGRWQPMFRPINPDRPFSGVNLAESFAEQYAQTYGVDVGLIPCADGGTSLEQWQPGGTIRKAIPSTALITAIMQAVQFSSKATETQKYLYFSCLQSRHCSIFISNPSRSSRLCRWLLPQALKILKYLYIPYSFVKVSLGFFLFFILKIRISLWQFRR